MPDIQHIINLLQKHATSDAENIETISFTPLEAKELLASLANDKINPCGKCGHGLNKHNVGWWVGCSEDECPCHGWRPSENA